MMKALYKIKYHSIKSLNNLFFNVVCRIIKLDNTMNIIELPHMHAIKLSYDHTIIRLYDHTTIEQSNHLTVQKKTRINTTLQRF